MNFEISKELFRKLFKQQPKQTYVKYDEYVKLVYMVEKLSDMVTLHQKALEIIAKIK